MSSITARCIPRLYWRFTASFVTQSKTVKIFLPKPTQVKFKDHASVLMIIYLIV